MQPIVDSRGWHASRQSNLHNRGLLSSLLIPYCANSLLCLDFIHGLPKFGGDDSCLVVTCGLMRFTPAFSCNETITGEQTVQFWLKNGLSTMGHLRRCTLTRMYASGVTPDDTSEY